MNHLQALKEELKKISSKTIILILCLTFITSGLLYMALVQQSPAPKQTSDNVVKKVSLAHTTLSLVDQTASASPYTTTKTIALVANPNENKVNGIQIELAYDPNVITNVIITPGTFFNHPLVLFHTIDKVDGRISYVIAAGLSDALATQSGVVAHLTLTVNPNATSSTTLQFLPKTKVTQDGTLDSVLKTAEDLTLTFPSAPSPLPNLQASPSGK